MNIKERFAKISQKQGVRSLEAEAFFDGVTGAPLDSSLQMTKAYFQKAIEKVKHAHIDRIKRLEGALKGVIHLRSDAENRWSNFKSETSGKVPPFFVPLIAVFFSLATAAAEAWFLAPVLQGWNINDPLPQFIVASIFVFTLGALSKAALSRYEKATTSDGWRNWFDLAALVVSAASFSVYLGTFRAGVLAHEARKNPELGSFLSDTTGTNIALSILGTALLPFAATIAIKFGCEKLSYWKQWRVAKADALGLAVRQEKLQGQLDAAVEKQIQEIAAIEAERDEWLHGQEQAYDEGKTLGPDRRPAWEMLLRVGAGGLIITALVMTVSYIVLDERLARILSEGTRLGLYAAIAVGASFLYGQRELRRWNTPSPKELYDSRSVKWPRDEESAIYAIDSGYPNGSETQDAGLDLSLSGTRANA